MDDKIKMLLRLGDRNSMMGAVSGVHMSLTAASGSYTSCSLISCSIMSRGPAYPFNNPSNAVFAPNSPSKASNTPRTNPYSQQRPANSAASSTAALLPPSQRPVQATLSPNRTVPQSLRSVASTSSLTSVGSCSTSLFSTLTFRQNGGYSNSSHSLSDKVRAQLLQSVL